MLEGTRAGTEVMETILRFLEPTHLDEATDRSEFVTPDAL